MQTVRRVAYGRTWTLLACLVAMSVALTLGGCGCRSAKKDAAPPDAERYPLPGVIDPVTERPVDHVQ